VITVLREKLQGNSFGERGKISPEPDNGQARGKKSRHLRFADFAGSKTTLDCFFAGFEAHRIIFSIIEPAA
jgi:hypothetical protein